MKQPILLATTLLLPAFAGAADPDPAAQEYLIDLPVVLTVSRLPQLPAELPASVTVIDKEMIAASGALDIPDLLRLVAGFQVGRYNGEGVRTTVTYHGNSDNYARRMQVLVDGRSVYNPATGGVEWQDLEVALEDIRRIEVTRGPNGVAYGANAFLGVVNIITENPAEQRGSLISHTRGEGEYERTYLRQAGRAGELDYRLAATLRADTGLRDLGGPEEDEVNDGQRTGTLTLRADWRPGANDLLTFDAGLGEGRRERGTRDDPLDPTRNRDARFDYQQLRWEHLISSEQEFRLNLYRTANRLDDRFLSPLLSEILDVPPTLLPLLLGAPDQRIAVDNSIQVERQNAEAEHRFRLSPWWRVVWGGELRRDRITAAGYLGSPEGRENDLYRLFVNNELKPADGWVVNLGTMLEGSDTTSERLSPRAAVNYAFHPDHYLRASYSEAYRNPALFEAYADYAARLADGTVLDALYHTEQVPDPERIEAYELAMGGSFAGRRIAYELKLFQESITDVITDADDRGWPDLLQNGAWILMNGGSGTSEGAELQLRATPTESSLLSFALAHAYTHGRVLDARHPDTWVPSDASTPRTTASLLLSNLFPNRLRASLGLYHVSDMEWLGPGDPTGGYTAADLTLSQGFRAGGSSGELTLILRNLAGDYFDYHDWVYQERRAYVRLAIGF